MLLANNIKVLRIEKNITVAELGRISGLAPSILWNIDSGKTKNPRINVVVKIAKALEVSLDSLVYKEL